MHYKNKIFSMVCVVFFLLISGYARADFYKQAFTFNKENFYFEKIDNFDLVSIPIHQEEKDYDFSREIGKPQLPFRIVHLVLPSGKEISRITIISKESEYLEGKYSIYPAQPPQILSRPANEIEFVKPSKEIYESSQAYPDEIVKIAKRGYLSGYNIGSLLIYPLQYIPKEKKLIFHSKIEIEISYKDTEKLPIHFSKRTDFAETILKETIKDLVKNSDDVPQFLSRTSPKNSNLPDEEHLYVVITSNDLASCFEPLSEWKLKKGLSATIVTTSWIYSEYSGIDQAEQIRNFIIDAYQNWGTLWVLLGGDINQVAYRTAFAFDCEYGEYWENFIPCDLYFSDLDGDWNANGNDIFGELDDNIDMYPDVMIGRASVQNTSEASAFVDKILTYEKTPPTDYQLDMLFLAMILWWDPYTDSGIGKDHIDDMYVPDRFDPITKLYQSLGNETYDNVMTALNSGQNIINHDGHAWWYIMGIGDGYLFNEDMDALTNEPAYSILYSIGCWPAAFDYDCIAEHFVTNSDGGGVAFIGNSRYGWGSPGNPVYGYSDRFDQQFFHHLFDNNIYYIGSTLAAAKSTYIPLAGEENVYRWCEYEINLLGEPEMPIWTDIPNYLTVTSPVELPLGNCFCSVTVTDGSNPVEGALVCLMQQGDVYETAITGIDGQVDFQISTSNPANDLYLTVTAQNFIPFEITISLISDEPYVKIESYSTNDSWDGYVIPGELTSMDIWLHNYGNQNATGVSVLLTSDNSKITMIDSIEAITNISAGDSVLIQSAFSFDVNQNLLNGEVVYLNYEISDDAGHTWSDLVSVTGATPVISYFYHDIIDSLGGDGDGIAEPGEFVNPHIILRNSGLNTADSVTAELSTDSPYIDIPILFVPLSFGDIQPSGFGDAFADIGIDENCPTPYFPQINIGIWTEDGYAFTDSFFITIGETGFYDNMENGEDNWTHSGTDDLWHLTSHRKFSGDYSWYCGNEGQFVYNDNIEEFLVATPVTIGQNAELSFWCWYEFPNYGTDGFYAEINDGSGWIDLDFIGSGGALGTLTTGNDWLEYKYDLSQYPAETELTLRFRFVSDEGDVAEGVYIDDVRIYEKSDIIVAEFSADVTYGIMPLSVQFTDVSNSVVDSIVDWFWEFGDGETSTEQNPMHIYEIQGKKTVSLTVTDEFNLTATKTKINYIDVATGGGYVVYVNPDGSGDYTNLHDGMEAVYDGDTLLVADALYTGTLNKNISFDSKNVTVISEYGPENCILDGENAGFAFEISNNDFSIVSGFTFNNFNSFGNGGGINCENASARIENCIFQNCISEFDGGAVFSSNSENLFINNCEFISCGAASCGAIGTAQSNNLVIDSCNFNGNSANIAAGIFVDSNPSTLIKNCSFSNNNASNNGGGIYISDCDSVAIIDCDILDNSAENGGGICSYTCNSFEVKDVLLLNNEVSQYGGGLYLSEVDPIIENCIVSGNTAKRGAGIYLTSANPQVVNCLITDNSATSTSGIGGGIFTDATNLVLVNCTIANNSAVSFAGGIFVYGSTVNVQNSIFWADTPQEIFPPSADLIAEYSDIQGGWSGTGNIDSDPLFIAGTPLDYHLQGISPCIDTGLNNYVILDYDLDGNVRIWDGDGDDIAIVDMGCYEFGAPPVSVEPEPEPQSGITLYQNYPNPFGASTTISFHLATGLRYATPRQAENTQIKVYNIKGQLVKKLGFRILDFGFGEAVWDGKDDNGNQVSSGIYFYQISTKGGSASGGKVSGDYSKIRKMVILR